MPDARIYLIRHGLAVHNVLEAPGHCNDSYVLDPPLVSQGRREALDAGHAFALHSIPVDVIYTSPLFRALQTTALLRRAGWGDASQSYRAVPQAVPPVRVVEALRERGSACTADWRQPASMSAVSFPEFDFSGLLPSADADPSRAWESPEQAAARATDVFKALCDFIAAEKAAGRVPVHDADSALGSGGGGRALSLALVSHASFLDDLLQSDAGLYGLRPVGTPMGPPYSYEDRAIRNGAVFAFDVIDPH
jgi:broad specificity phosphatase PhoE